MAVGIEKVAIEKVAREHVVEAIAVVTDDAGAGLGHFLVDTPGKLGLANSVGLGVLRGDAGLFIRADELAATWDIFTPVLKDIEEKGVLPVVYPFGSDGPGETSPS